MLCLQVSNSLAVSLLIGFITSPSSMSIPPVVVGLYIGTSTSAASLLSTWAAPLPDAWAKNLAMRSSRRVGKSCQWTYPGCEICFSASTTKFGLMNSKSLLSLEFLCRHASVTQSRQNTWGWSEEQNLPVTLPLKRKA